MIGGEPFDDDIEEEKVGFWGGEVVVKAMEDDLGVGLVELGESCGLVQEV